MKARIQFFVIISLILGEIVVARIIEDEDTVIIDARIPEVPRGKRQIQEESYRTEDEDTVLIRSQHCITPRGKRGQCMSLRECYPILFPLNSSIEMGSESDGAALTMNDPLADQLIAASGFCGGGQYSSDSPSLFAQVVRAEVLVCCVPQSKIPQQLPEEAPNVTVADASTDRMGCGQLKIEPKIVAGVEAQRGEFPWIVALMNSNKQFCGGSIIDKHNIVTAAHCVQHMTAADVQKLTIQIGDHDIYSTSDGQHVVRTASRILYHRGFSMQHLHHDIALITMSQPITFTNYIQPVCLHPGSPSYDNVNGDVAGWGQIRDGGPQPSKLRRATVRVLPHSECAQRYGSNAPGGGIGKGMVCAGGDGPDSCRGDSGGPLTINSRTRAQLIGAVSFGIGCGSYPGVYTRVDQYLSWISKNRKKSLEL